MGKKRLKTFKNKVNRTGGSKTIAAGLSTQNTRKTPPTQSMAVTVWITIAIWSMNGISLSFIN